LRNKSPYRYRVLILLFFLLFITYLDRISIGFFSEEIKSAFHLSYTQWGLIMGAFSLSYALFEIPSGVWGDRIGQRAIFIRIVLWWSLFTAFTGLATGFLSLLMIRFLFGMGEAGAFPNTAAVISKWFPAQQTSRGISIAWSGMNAGAAFAPLLVLAVAGAYGWRATFFVNGAIGILWVLVCVFWFRNNPSEMKGITEAERNFIESNRRHSDHLQKYSWKKILKNRSLLALITAFSTSQCANYFFLVWGQTYLTNAKHFVKDEIKWTYFIAYALATICCFFGGYLSDWIIKRKSIGFGRRSFGFVILAISGLSILIQTFASNHTLISVAFIIGISFYSSIGIPSYGTCVDIGGGRAATIAGTMNFCGQFTAFLFVTFFGKLVDISGFNFPVYILVVILIAGALLWFLVDPSKPLVVDEEIKPASVNPPINQLGLT
jgi:ACS family glucarate transporter-like MFS transporter